MFNACVDFLVFAVRLYTSFRLIQTKYPVDVVISYFSIKKKNNHNDKNNKINKTVTHFRTIFCISLYYHVE